jgi:hypothetical protein
MLFYVSNCNDGKDIAGSNPATNSLENRDEKYPDPTHGTVSDKKSGY